MTGTFPRENAKETKMPAIPAGFFHRGVPFAEPSLPLDRRRRLRGDIVTNAVTTLYFVDDAVTHLREEVVRKPRPIGRHSIPSCHGAKRDSVFIGPLFTHGTDGLDGEDDGEALPELLVKSCSFDLFDKDRVRLAENIEFFALDGSRRTHAKAGAGERLPENEFSRHAKLEAHGADLVLEEQPKRLDELEIHAFGKAAHVVMTLNDALFPAAERDALDDVGINRALNEEAGAFDPSGLALKDLDEEPPDDLSLHLGIRHACELMKKLFRCVDVDEVDVEMIAELLDDFLRLAFTEEAVVDEDARQTIADGAMDEFGGDARIHPTREGAEDLRLLAHLSADRIHGLVHERAGRPSRRGPGDLKEERLEDRPSNAVGIDLGMEGHAINLKIRIFECRDFHAIGARDRSHRFGKTIDAIGIGDQALDRLTAQPREEPRARTDRNRLLVELELHGARDRAAEHVGEEGRSITDSECRNRELKDRRRNRRCVLFVKAPSAPRKNQRLGLARLDGP